MARNIARLTEEERGAIRTSAHALLDNLDAL
jgi:hypothetical protein